MTATSAKRRNVHPFPARMAPDVALDKITSLTKTGDLVLDPMCGSGTVPRLAVEEDRRAIACDLDPLAVMITRTGCKPDWSADLGNRATALVQDARRLRDGLPDWIVKDPDSVKFVHYWFAEEQRQALSRVARLLADRPSTDDPLRIALSRMIVTKDGGASLARDTSHSRPHRVRLENDFDVFDEFIKSAERTERIVAEAQPLNRASIRSVDARTLAFVDTSSVDLVVTSPPYLNAIDYLRGHRMSLVWLGHQISHLRAIRGDSIGAERGLRKRSASITAMTQDGVPRLDELSNREQNMVHRFSSDLNRLCRSLSRVTKVGGRMVFVVADSQLKGVPVSNSALCKLAALQNGFAFEEGVVRLLPAQHRYLPPPSGGDGMNARMREEAVLTFERVPFLS